MGTVMLREICHSRAGDKGDTSNIALIVYDKADYDLVSRQVTADRVKDYFGTLCLGSVVRYDLQRMGAFNFVLEHALDGGVTRSLRIDGHGKSLSAYLLSMTIETADRTHTL